MSPGSFGDGDESGPGEEVADLREGSFVDLKGIREGLNICDGVEAAPATADFMGLILNEVEVERTAWAEHHRVTGLQSLSENFRLS